MKRWLMVIAVVLSLALVIGIACGEEEEAEEVRELKIGVGVTFTGAYGAIVGFNAKAAFDMAAEDIGVFEVAGERYCWKPIYEDNLLTPEGGLTSARKLIHEHGVDFMHQGYGPCGWAASSLTEEIPMILDMSASSPALFGPHAPHTFMTATVAASTGVPAVYDWLVKEHPEMRRVAVTSTETPEGELGLKIHGACCDLYGLELESAVTTAAMVEYYPVATKLMGHDPDVVFGSVELFAAMWDFGFDGLCVMGSWVPSYANMIGWDRAQDIVIFDLHPIGGLWPEVEALSAEFEHRAGLEYTFISLWVMNILYIFTDALQQAGTVDDVEKIVDTLETGTFDSPVGPMQFGGEEINGIGHVGIWPVPIFEIVGEDEYRVITVYSADEARALLDQVARMMD